MIHRAVQRLRQTSSQQRVTSAMVLLAGLALGASAAAQESDAATIQSLQAEVAKLREELAAKDLELAKERGRPTNDQQAPALGQTDAGASGQSQATSASIKPKSPQKLKKVVVRSRARLERVQDVPQSISVIGGQQLQDELALNIGAIAQRAADVVRGSGNSRTFALVMRGVGKVTQTEAQDISVGIVEDGVNFAYAPFGSFDFYDVDSVEVAKGPQGTAGGHAFTVGKVSFTTKNPSFTPDASWSLAFGQHATVISQIAGGGPVIDDLLAWRGALTVNKGNGAYVNGYNTDQTYFNTDRVSGRVKLLLTPNQDFSALGTLELQPTGAEFYNSGVVTLPMTHYTNTGVSVSSGNGTSFDVATKLGRSWFTNQLGGQNFFYSGLLNRTSFDVNSQQPLYTYTNGASLQLKQNLGDFDLTSLTSTRQYHFAANNDDQTPFNITIGGGGKVDLYKQVSEELSLSNKPGGFVDWKTGAYLWENRVDFGQTAPNKLWGSDAGAYFANNPQYNMLYYGQSSASGVPQLGWVPSASGQLLLNDSLDNLAKSSEQTIHNKSAALFAQADWHWTDLLTLTTGFRLQYDDRTNITNSGLLSNGSGGGLNPTAVNGVQLGGFNSNPTTGGLMAGNTAVQIALANQVAQRYFGVSNYTALSSTQMRQVAAAKAIRSGQIGTLWNTVDGPVFHKTMPGINISPSYKFTPDETGYLALQYGEKGGVSQVVNGVPLLARPEKAQNIELGLKSALLNRTLIVDADMFKSIIHNYQQVEVITDPLAPTTTVQYTGNAPQVDIYGLELDSSYVATRDLTLHASGAYAVAKYKNFPNSPLPLNDQVVNNVVTQNVSGQLLPGAARLTLNIGAEYRKPIWNDKLFHASFNTAFTTRYNSDTNLSTLAWIPGHSITDASLGLGRQDQKFDASLIVKNLFNNRTPQTYSLSTTSAAAYSYVPALPRWWGIQFSGKF